MEEKRKDETTERTLISQKNRSSRAKKDKIRGILSGNSKYYTKYI